MLLEDQKSFMYEVDCAKSQVLLELVKGLEMTAEPSRLDLKNQAVFHSPRTIVVKSTLVLAASLADSRCSVDNR